MKICPKCNAVNKDTQPLCVDCDSYIGNVSPIPEGNYIDNAIAKSHRQSKIRKIVFTTLFLAFYGFFVFFTMTLCIQIYGDLKRYFLYSLLYIPCLILFFFPYHKVYCWYRKKRKKPEKYLSDTIISMFKAIAWVYLVILYMGTFDMLNMVE
jgi:hypothetical protein